MDPFFLNKKKIEISLVNKNFYSIKLFRTRRILIMCYKIINYILNYFQSSIKQNWNSIRSNLYKIFTITCITLSDLSSG